MTADAAGPSAQRREFPTFRGAVTAAAAALAFYLASVPPSVWWGDSAEFAIRAAHLDLSPIARGYPLHRLLCWMAGLASGSPAIGANVVSAVFGAVSAGLAWIVGLRIGGSRAGAAAAAATLTLCPVFWLYAGVAEVYTLHAAFLLGILWAAWECGSSRRAPFVLGLLFGLSFLHHRMTAFAAPGILVLAAGRLGGADGHARWRAADASRGALRVLGGFAVGIIPFAVLCAVASRSPPAGTADPLRWWIGDVFLGGEQNATHLFGSGQKSFLANAAYVVRWTVYGLPGPALLLSLAGLLMRVRGAAGPRSDAWGLLLLVAAHVVFPFRYDWTGDQFSFLIPLLAIGAVLVAPGVAALESRRPGWGLRAAWLTAAAPVAVALLLAYTPLGARAWPGLEAESRRTLALPLRLGDDGPREFASANLARLPQGALLHSDWGDGQVYLYLQRVDGMRTDVEIRIWYGGGPRLLRSGREEWVSAMPGQIGGPPALRSLAGEFEDRGGGLFRVPPGGGRK